MYYEKRVSKRVPRETSTNEQKSTYLHHANQGRAAVPEEADGGAEGDVAGGGLDPIPSVDCFQVSEE